MPVLTSALTCSRPTAPSQSQLTKVVKDKAGNVFVGGIFRGSIILGATTLTAVSDYDLFVAKLVPAAPTVGPRRLGATTGTS